WGGRVRAAARGAAAASEAAGRSPAASDAHQCASALDLHPDRDPDAGRRGARGCRRVAVATSLIRRAAWPLAAALALAFLIGLALHGQRPDAGLAAFKPGGLLTTFVPEGAREGEVLSGGGTLPFRRDSRPRHG